MIIRRLILAILLGLVPHIDGGAAALFAQAAPAKPGEIPVGARVRVLAPTSRSARLTGQVLQVTSDTLVVAPKRGPAAAIPLSAISEIEVSAGRSHGQGAINGFGIGALTGGIAMGTMVLLGADFCIYISCLRHDLAGAAGGFLIGGALGAPFGTLMGALIGLERWRPLERSGVQALIIGPGHVRVTIAAP